MKLANCFALRTWTNALVDANDLMTGSCNLTDGSVATDWQLPNIKELLSLVDYGESNPALPMGHPFMDVQSGFYWSSSSIVPLPEHAWGLGMGGGSGLNVAKTSGVFVWPVRGGQ